jgi:hypothetical protein
MSENYDFIKSLRTNGRRFLDAVVPVLETQRSEAEIDVYQPVSDEVMGGLFARIFRFLQVFVLDYHVLADDLGRVILRMMLESLFYLRFLSRQEGVAACLAFQQYGIGQQKLYKMQLRKLLEEGELDNSAELRAFIDSDSDEEIWDELVNVRLKNFEDLRRLATDVGMKTEYVLQYQPHSTVIHGHWPSLRLYNLVKCQEPMHRDHLQPTFDLPPLNPSLIPAAFKLFTEAYELWIGKYGLEDRITPLIDKYWQECEANLEEKGSATDTSSQPASENA